MIAFRLVVLTLAVMAALNVVYFAAVAGDCSSALFNVGIFGGAVLMLWPERRR